MDWFGDGGRGHTVHFVVHYDARFGDDDFATEEEVDCGDGRNG
jgi:hypothetical protein